MYDCRLNSNDPDAQLCDNCEVELEREDWGHSSCLKCREEHAIALDEMYAANRKQRKRIEMAERDRAAGRTVKDPDSRRWDGNRREWVA